MTQPTLSALWICTAGSRERSAIYRRYVAALSKLECSWELIVILVDPTPGSEKEISELFQQEQGDHRAICIRRRCPDSTAIQAGLNASRGEWIAVLPAYLQIEPEDIVPMLNKLQEGYDYVASWRHPRVDTKWAGFKSRMFNALTRATTGSRLHDINSGLRLMRRQVTEHVPIYGDLDRFLPIMTAMQGYRVTEVPVRHLEERSTKGDNSIGLFVRRLLDLLTLFFLFKFTKKPLRFFGLIGSGMLAAGIVWGAVVVAERLLGGVPLSDRPALLFSVLLFAMGVQLFSVGLLGELIIFTHADDLRDVHVELVYEVHSTPDSRLGREPIAGQDVEADEAELDGEPQDDSPKESWLSRPVVHSARTART